MGLFENLYRGLRGQEHCNASENTNSDHPPNWPATCWVIYPA